MPTAKSKTRSFRAGKELVEEEKPVKDVVKQKSGAPKKKVVNKLR